MSKIKLSEIRAHYEGMAAKDTAAFYLLDLVKGLGKELGNQQCPACEKYFNDPGKPCAGCKEARALLEEIKL